MIWLTIFIVIVLTIIYNVKKSLRYKRMINTFPGRSNGHIILGDIVNFSTKPDEVFLQFRDYNREFPNGYRFWSFNQGIVGVNTPEVAEIILSSTKHIKKSILYNLLKPWLKTGLLTSTGKKWFQRRKLLTPAFHFNILQKLTNNFGEYIDKFIQELNEISSEDGIDIVPLISKLSLNIMCGTAMGVTQDSNTVTQKQYRNAIHDFTVIITERSMKPWLFVDPIFRFTSNYNVQKKLLKILHQFTSDIIKEREERFMEDDFDENDTYLKSRLALLDLLLSAKKRREIDDAGIREEVDTFTFEGHDTISMGLSFILLMLAYHQDCQKKVIDELDDIFGDSSRAATYQDLQNMHYLELCVKESLRLYPSVPFISRVAEEDIPLSGKYVIPEGAIVHIHIYDIHRNEKIYPEPEKFDPNRFLPENIKGRHPFAYIPFSAGSRNCIGQKFAMLEIKSIVSSLLRQFELEAVDKPSDIKLNMELVLRPRDGIRIKFKSRTK